MPRSENRRPRTAEKKRMSPPQAAAHQAADATGESQDDTSQNDLLKWAEEVLRQAEKAAQKVPSRGTAAEEEDLPQMPPRAPSLHAERARKKAERLKEELRRSAEESQRAGDQLNAAEAYQRRQRSEEEEAWKKRVREAAQDMRSNLPDWTFKSE